VCLSNNFLFLSLYNVIYKNMVNMARSGKRFGVDVTITGYSLFGEPLSAKAASPL
jgi:hypothetical protein